jgi:hypothetical protein
MITEFWGLSIASIIALIGLGVLYWQVIKLMKKDK